MASTKFYKQSVFDHASLSIAVSFFDKESLNCEVNNLLLNYIRRSFEFLNLRPWNNNNNNNINGSGFTISLVII